MGCLVFERCVEEEIVLASFILLLSPKTALRMGTGLGILASLLEVGKMRLREAARLHESITELHL